MGQMPPPEVRDFHLRDALGVLQHLLQLDPIERAAFFPQGFFDQRVLTEDPDPPPLGRMRSWFREDGLAYRRENAGPIKGALTRAIHFDSGDIGKGATAPTETTIGSTPTVPVLLFDATNETANIVTSFRPDMNLGKSFTLRIQFALVNVQLDLDQLDVAIDYVVFRTGATGNGPNKTSTSLSASLQVATAEGLAIADVYSLGITIPFDDETNPLNATGAAGIAIEFSLANVAEVAAIHVIDADIEYAALF